MNILSFEITTAIAVACYISGIILLFSGYLAPAVTAVLAAFIWTFLASEQLSQYIHNN
jgi:hypothetical protein